MADNRLQPHAFKASRARPAQRPPMQRPRRKILSSAGKRLSTILEQSNPPAEVPPPRSAFSRLFLRSKSPARKSIEKQPQISESTLESDATDSSLESDQRKGLAENKHIARRGGWKRLALVLLVLLIIVLALGLGLGFGLARKINSSSTTTPASDSISSSASSSSSSTPNPSATGVPPSDPHFPTGSYSLVTFLSSVQTNCTANPATWTCFPYTTYAANPSGALATFNWAISSSSSSPSSTSRLVSSAQDPFAITFGSQPLTLLDAGQPSERYAFNLTMAKQVSPSGSITPDDAATTCFYNSTTLQASLYTKMAKSYTGQGPTGAGSSGDGNGGMVGGGGASYTPWPFAVQVEQVAGGGQDVPNCYKMDNGAIGERITDGLDPEGMGSECSCVYQNYDPPA